MDRGPMINRYIVGSSDWIEVLRYFCHRAAAEDRRFAMRMNLLRQEIVDVCEYKRNLADELCSVRSVIAPIKAVELLNDTLMKDEAKMAQLSIARFTEVDLALGAGEVLSLSFVAAPVSAF
ncbi:hypothetical protein Tco_0612595 [Tanacetum coccineum]